MFRVPSEGARWEVMDFKTNQRDALNRRRSLLNKARSLRISTKSTVIEKTEGWAILLLLTERDKQRMTNE